MRETDRAEHSEARAESSARRRVLMLAGLALFSAVAIFVVAAVLITIFERKQEARTPFVRVAEVDEVTTDPEPWGRNWPHQYDGYKATAGDAYYGGSSAMPESKLEQDPWLKRLYAGYAFSIDYREARGHAYMLYDQTVTERVTKRPQAGACLHCHGSTTVLYRKVGLEAMGQPADTEALKAGFNEEAVIRGFKELSPKPYHEVLDRLKQMPDGTPDDTPPSDTAKADASGSGGETLPESHPTTEDMGGAHPVSCIDCHDPESMSLRVTRPGFVLGIAALARSDEPVPHLPSIEKWREGSRDQPYDPNRLATRQEMRTFACAQCHVEYYCANKMTLTFPWGNGLKAEQIEQTWDEQTFPDGSDFYDYEHAETGAKLYKAQHPEFELWSQGVHAQSGVSCADCHMPYERRGAMKISSHNIQSPLENINNACMTCHSDDESQLRAKVATIQGRTEQMKQRAADAMTDMLDAILEAKAAGVASDKQLKALYELQRKAMWRLDFISSENSRGFHADQEAVRILGESIDYSRQAQAKALRLHGFTTPDFQLPENPVQGVTPTNPEELNP